MVSGDLKLRDLVVEICFLRGIQFGLRIRSKKIRQRLRCMLATRYAIGEHKPTARFSRGFRRAVRGVLPRKFPGVLNTSVTFL